MLKKKQQQLYFKGLPSLSSEVFSFSRLFKAERCWLVLAIYVGGCFTTLLCNCFCCTVFSETNILCKCLCAFNHQAITLLHFLLKNCKNERWFVVISVKTLWKFNELHAFANVHIYKHNFLCFFGSKCCFDHFPSVRFAWMPYCWYLTYACN